MIVSRDDGWCQGINASGLVGFFPQSYVRPVEAGEQVNMHKVWYSIRFDYMGVVLIELYIVSIFRTHIQSYNLLYTILTTSDIQPRTLKVANSPVSGFGIKLTSHSPARVESV